MLALLVMLTVSVPPFMLRAMVSLVVRVLLLTVLVYGVARAVQVMGRCCC